MHKTTFTFNKKRNLNHKLDVLKKLGKEQLVAQRVAGMIDAVYDQHVAIKTYDSLKASTTFPEVDDTLETL